MEKLSAKSVADATGGRIIKGEAGLEACGVSIDSCTTGEGDVFFALKGAKADAHGNDFAVVSQCFCHWRQTVSSA